MPLASWSSCSLFPSHCCELSSSRGMPASDASALVPWFRSLLSLVPGSPFQQELWAILGDEEGALRLSCQTCYPGVTVMPSAADCCLQGHNRPQNPSLLSPLSSIHPNCQSSPELLLADLPLLKAPPSHCACGLGRFVLLLATSA